MLIERQGKATAFRSGLKLQQVPIFSDLVKA